MSTGALNLRRRRQIVPLHSLMSKTQRNERPFETKGETGGCLSLFEARNENH